MMNARERMLGRLRAAAPGVTGGAIGADGAMNAPDAANAIDAVNAVNAVNALDALDARIAAHYAGPRPDAAARIDALEAAMRMSRADVWRATAEEWPAQLAAKLVAHGVKRLLLDKPAAEGAALAGALPADMESLAFAGPLEAWKGELFSTIDAGFTVARSGIAATGTLILAPDAGTPRTVSLVPPLHIALVYADTLHATLHDAARAERWGDGMPSNLVLASGPSKTSDIQQTLAFGAHGPRWMWVVIVTERNKP
jgi:L-lactate dehydrogenase complex protein LldG